MKHISSQIGQKEPRLKDFEYWFSRNIFYHKQVVSFYQGMVEENARVLHLQSGNGYVLASLNPKVGVGVERNEQSIQEAQNRWPHYHFYESIAAIPPQSFDVILLSFGTMEADDIHDLLLSIQPHCTATTRILLERYPALWSPILSLAQKCGLKRPTLLKNWVSNQDLRHFISLADFEVITQGGYLLIPLYIPLLTYVLNSFIAYLPFINRLCLHQWMVLRTQKIQKTDTQHSISVVIPVRNEMGNIEQAVLRCPNMGSHTEFIFVEGNSTDATYAEIERVIQKYPHRDIKLFKQDGRGKGDAVRKGFSHAQGDILMILDGDLTAPPEDLPKFYKALVSGKGEFINGSRLVYGMESEAMTFLSWVANTFFGTVLSWIVGQSITDSLCGTKVLWKKDYEKIAHNRTKLGLADPFGDFDLIFGAAQLHLKIVDVPVHYKRRTYGQTNISRFKEVWFLLWMCIQAIRKIKIK